MRFGWHQQGKGVIALDGVLVKVSRLVAGDRKVVALGHEPVRQLNGGNALWTVAGAGKRDQQQRVCRAEVIHRVGDQIGCRYGGDVFTGVARKPGGNYLANKRGGARAGEDDPQVSLTQQRLQETVNRGAQIIDVVE